MTVERNISPVLVEIIRNGVIAVTEEMKTNLMRTAYNMIIYEALDFTVGLFTPQGETVSIGLGLPMFTRGMAEVVQAKIRRFGAEMEAGDIYITNDAYLTGSHLNHVTLTAPIFHEGELIGFSCCMAHWLDIGGSLDAVTTDIWQEGLQIPLLKYRSAGRVNEDLLGIIRLNVRLPDLAMGDLRAQTVAVTTGETRFLELVGRYGRGEVACAIASIMEASERMARAETARIPDGVYEATSFMDDDGIAAGARIPIRVKVTIEGERMIVDLSDVSPQVAGFFNSGVSTGISCAQVAYKCLTSPGEYPVNDGNFRALEVIMPPGRVISATRPAPMRWWMTFPMTVIDTIFRALAGAVPDRVIAGHHADLVSAGFYGVGPDGRFFMGSIGPTGGGWGAKAGEDGVGVTVCINDGDTHNSPTEQIEAKYPILVERYALREDSGGAGCHRGGLGAERVVEALFPFTMLTAIERIECRPWGLEGGMDGAGNGLAFREGGVWREAASGKVHNKRIARGDAFCVRSGGGGGFGDPKHRDTEKIMEDVKQGYVSAGSARVLYGVSIDTP